MRRSQCPTPHDVFHMRSPPLMTEVARQTCPTHYRDEERSSSSSGRWRRGTRYQGRSLSPNTWELHLLFPLENGGGVRDVLLLMYTFEIHFSTAFTIYNSFYIKYVKAGQSYFTKKLK